MNTPISSVPPPIQPSTGSNNPYEFITNPENTPKKPVLGGSKVQRIMIFVGALSVLLIIVLLFINFLGNSDGDLKDDYQTMVNQQSELIRISTIGVEKSRSSDAKNLAITTKLSLESSQPELNKLASKSGANTNAKYLSQTANSENDNQLTNADQSNNFDEVFIQMISLQLNEYKISIQKLYDQTTKENSKQTLRQAFENATTLMQNGQIEN